MKYSIKTIWLSFIAVVVLLPSVIIIPWFAYYEFDRQLSDVLLHESLLNAELEKKLEYELNHFINLLENKSDPIGYELVAQRDKNLIHPLLEIIMKREKAIHGLLVVSDRGEIKASMDRLGNEVYRLEKPEGITDASWIKTHWGLLWEKTFRSPEFVVPILGRKYISPASEHEGTYLFRISLPVLYKGKTKGFLIAEISIDNLWNNWKHVGSDIGNNSYMVDRRGVLLVDVQYGKYRAGDLLTHLAIVRDGISSRRGINNDAYKGVSGKQVFGTTQTIPLLNWTLVSEVNERSIIKPIRQTILTAVFLAILLITICLLIGMRMMRAFIFPIENLTSAIEMYGHDEAALKQTPETNIKELNTVIKGFNRMVVERSQMDDVLRSSKERLLLHRDQSPLGVIEWNTKFEFVDWNPAAEKIFCFTKNEVLGKHITETILPESARQIVDEIWQALLQRTGGTHSINENMTKDGRIILCEWHNTPLVNKAGKIVGIASFVEDITDKKLLEEQNRRSQKMDALGKLTGGISHDFNNLLNAILGYANLISERAENEKLKKFADIIIQAGKRGTKLTKKLLSFSAQEAGKLSIVDINSLIKDEEHILEKSLTAR
ncbi:MAG: PAS domain S-box protein, partial [Gammaproteobacteria bacterium]|nr:PAS domain S-box protein [Gammaproteobacteria bacterium]